MASLKPQKPELFSGRRDAVAVNTCLYQVEMYLNLLQVTNPQIVLDQNTRVSFASTLMKCTAVQWWYMLVQSGQAPGNWEEFLAKVRLQFIPRDSVERARDKLRGLHQKSSVLSYLNEFRNTMKMIPGISEDEKLDEFVSGLKRYIHLKVRKSRPADFESAAQIALTIDSALFSMGMYNRGTNDGGSSSGTVPMDIGNVESGRRRTDKRSKPRSYSGKWSKEKMYLYENNLCFVCHKKGCRASNHAHGDHSVNNISAASSRSDSESEN